MILDPEKRYLLCRPVGGMNDQLVQIYKAFMHAKKFDRVLVVDTKHFGLRVDFDSIFDLSDAADPQVIAWRDSMLPAFDAATTVIPKTLTHRFSTYKVDWGRADHQIVDKETQEVLDFDLDVDHDAQVLFRQTAGGGLTSAVILSKLRFQPQIADRIVERLLLLGGDYDAVHIRHSDYQTKFKRFLLRLRPALKNRRVLICSDNRAAKAAAALILHRSTTVLSSADIPDTGGKPLHTAALDNPAEVTLDLLCDLIGMALSQTLFFTSVSRVRMKSPRFSGYSVLAETLRRNPRVVRNLLSQADPVALGKLLSLSHENLSPMEDWQTKAQFKINQDVRSFDDRFKWISKCIENA